MIANVLPLSLQNNPRLDRWLAILPGGRVRLSVGKVELGQGVMTALAQIAAEELYVALPRLDLVAGDTDCAPDEGMTTGSMSIEVSGASVRIVCAEAHALFVEQAARTLGAGRLRSFFQVTLPSIRWAVAYGVTLTIARTLGEFGAVLVVSGNISGRTQTFPIFIYDDWDQRFDTLGAYSGALLLALISMAVLFVLAMLRKRERKLRVDLA